VKGYISASLASLVFQAASMAAPADSNGNGMSDAWERRFRGYNLFPPAIHAAGDEDGDGKSNYDESLAGTNPFDGKAPHGFLQVSVRDVPATFINPEGSEEPVMVTPEAFLVSWPTKYGKLYTLYGSPDLDSGSWTKVGDSFYSEGETIEIGTVPTEQGGTLAECYFWRVAVMDTDTDGDGYPDHDEWLKGTDIMVADRDDDGMSDEWEILHNLDPDDDGTGDSQTGPWGDLDQDSLDNLVEYWFGTNPRNPDTDSDLLTDGEESYSTYTDPLLFDSNGNGVSDAQEDMDRDGLTNLAELRIHLTNPQHADTDWDQLLDGWELANGLDPLFYNDTTEDPDQDMLTNRQEQLLGLNPNLNDTDQDGVLDKDEDADGDGLTNYAEIYTYFSNPFKADGDKDGLDDYEEILIHLTNSKYFDSDGDALPDGWEVQYNLNPLSAEGTNGASEDREPDGVNNFKEYLNHSNPNLADTDNDGVDDLTEITQGSDPNDAEDGGNPPPPHEILPVPFQIWDPSGSHSEKWKLTINGHGPQDVRTITLTSADFGAPGTEIYQLRKGQKYEVTIDHVATDPEWLDDNDDQADYDWSAVLGGTGEVDENGELVDALPSTVSMAAEEGNPGNNTAFVVGKHWLVDNREIVFTREKHGNDEDIASGKTAYLLPIQVRSAHAANDGHYDLDNNDESIYPRPGNVAHHEQDEALINSLQLYFEDCASSNSLQADLDVHFDFKVGFGDPNDLPGISWNYMEKPPGSPDLVPNEPSRLIRSVTNGNGNLRGGLYKLKLQGAEGIEPQVWLPLAGPDITTYWQSEIDYFRGDWGPAYRSKLHGMTSMLAGFPARRIAAKKSIAIIDMEKLGKALDWHGFPSGAYSPCGGPNLSGNENRLTMHGVVIDFRKRNNMMYALIGREMGIPAVALTGFADPTWNPLATGAPDSPAAIESYHAGYDLHNGVSLEDVMINRGKKMQEPGSWSCKEWPSWETAEQPLTRAQATLLDELIE
jgi:hypothetical protein